MTNISPNLKWKDKLLSSGIPLENMLAKKIEKLDLFISGEFDYLKVDENGKEKSFSVDLHAVKKIFDGLFIDFLFECKYKTPGTKWIFIPRREKDNYLPRSSYSYYDVFNDNYRIDYLLLPELSLTDVKVGIKGTEIFNSNENPSSIREGIHQIKYGLLESYISSAEDHLLKIVSSRNTTGLPISLRLSLGIIVTTAEIWLLNESTDISEIADSKEIDQVAVSLPYMYLRDLPSREFTNYSRKRISKRIADYKTDIPEWDEDLDVFRSEFFSSPYSFFQAENFSVSQIAICRIDNINELIEKHIERLVKLIPELGLITKARPE